MSDNDPTAGGAWNDGCDFAMTQLCLFLGVNQNDVRWDAATETVDGDVQAVIGNILRAKFGEDWGPDDTFAPAQPVAWTNEHQLGYLKNPEWASVPMAMWGKPNGAARIPLYASQASSAATVETEVRGQAHRDAISPSGGKMFNAHPSSSAANMGELVAYQMTGDDGGWLDPMPARDVDQVRRRYAVMLANGSTKLRALYAIEPQPLIKRIEGASDIVDEAACLIFAELCPGLIMGDEDRTHYENAAKAVLALPQTVPLAYRDTVRRIGQAREKRMRELRDALETIRKRLNGPADAQLYDIRQTVDAALALSRPQSGGGHD